MRHVKKWAAAFCLCLGLAALPTIRSQAQLIDAVLEAIKAAIVAADIAVQKVQNATIDLQNIQKQIENELSKLKLNEIADWTQRQKDLYQQYFDELKQVKTVIAYYKRVSDIIEKQKQLVSEYQQAYALVQQDKHFSASEVQYMYSVYSGIIEASVKNLDQLLGILESFTLSMSDAERLKIIDRAADGIGQQIRDLRRFNNQNRQLSLQRSRSLDEVSAVRKLYGL